MDTYIQITKRRYKNTPETKACSLIMEKKNKKKQKKPAKINHKSLWIIQKVPCQEN